MTTRFDEQSQLQPRDAADYGFARARDIAFDAVHALWRKRTDEGMKQTDLAEAIGRDRGWVSRNLRGPGNWTLRTLGELVEGMNGELHIVVHAQEDAPSRAANYSAYQDHDIFAEPYLYGAAQDGTTQILGPQAVSSVPVTETQQG